jgi:hypothetical protein
MKDEIRKMKLSVFIFLIFDLPIKPVLVIPHPILYVFSVMSCFAIVRKNIQNNRALVINRPILYVCALKIF